MPSAIFPPTASTRAARSEFRLMQILEAVCDLPLPSAPVHAFDSDAPAPVKAGTSNRRVQDACHRLLDAGHQNEVLTVFHRGEPGAKRRVCVDLMGGAYSPYNRRVAAI